MKIQCEQCKVGYNIDDASIGDRGIRAQCPRCNHITTIRKSQSAIMDQARARLDVAICVNCGKPAEPGAGDPIPVCADCQALSAVDIGAKTNPGAGAEAAPLPPSPALRAPPEYSPTATSTTPGAAPPMEWRVKKSPSGEIYGPFDHETISGWIETDKIIPADEISDSDGGWQPAHEHAEFGALFAGRYKVAPKPVAQNSDELSLDRERPADRLRPTSSPARPAAPARRASPRRTRPPLPWRAIFSFGVVAALAGTGYVLWSQGVIDLSRFQSDPPPPIADATDKRLDAIRDEYPEVTGTAEEHLRAGMERMAEDTVEGWTAARQDLHRALAVDRDDLGALAVAAEVNALLALYGGRSGYLDEAFRFSARAVERAPQDPAAHRATAATLLANGNPSNKREAARILNESVLPFTPDDPVAITMSAMAIAGDDPIQAERLLLEAMEKAPTMIRPRLELGILYQSTQRLQKALDTLRPITSKSFQASYRSGEIAESVGDYRQAAAAYDSAARVSEPTGGGPWVEATIASAAVQYQALGNLRVASARLRPAGEALLGDPALPPQLAHRLRLHLAIVARLEGQFQRSLELSQQVIDAPLAEFTPAAHFNAGLVRLRQGDLDGAARSLDEAEARGLDRRSLAEVFFWQAQVHVRRGDVPEASSTYEEAIRADPHAWRAVVGYATLLVEATGREVEAMDRLQHLARNDPSFYDQYQRVSLFHPDATPDLLKRATVSFGKVHQARQSDPRSASALGILAYLSGNLPRADAHFRASMSERNPDVAAHVFTGLIAERRGGRAALAQALERYTAVKTGAPSPFLSTSLGRVRIGLGEYDAANAEFQEALSQDPEYAPAHYWFGVLHRRIGEKGEARAKWADALKHDPNYVRASRAILEQEGS